MRFGCFNIHEGFSNVPYYLASCVWSVSMDCRADTHAQAHTYILFNFITYFPYFMTPWCTFWCFNVLIDVTMYFLMSYLLMTYGVLFNIMTYIPYILTLWHTFGVVTYFLTSWHTSWCHDVLNSWHHGVRCDVMTYIVLTSLRNDTFIDVMTYFLK